MKSLKYQFNNNKMVEIKAKIEQFARVRELDRLVLFLCDENPTPKFWEVWKKSNQLGTIEIPLTDEFVEGDNVVIKIEKVNEETLEEHEKDCVCCQSTNSRNLKEKVNKETKSEI